MQGAEMVYPLSLFACVWKFGTQLTVASVIVWNLVFCCKTLTGENPEGRGNGWVFDISPCPVDEKVYIYILDDGFAAWFLQVLFLVMDTRFGEIIIVDIAVMVTHEGGGGGEDVGGLRLFLKAWSCKHY